MRYAHIYDGSVIASEELERFTLDDVGILMIHLLTFHREPKQRLDVRVFKPDVRGQFTPTTIGVTITPNLIASVRRALDQLEASERRKISV